MKSSSDSFPIVDRPFYDLKLFQTFYFVRLIFSTIRLGKINWNKLGLKLCQAQAQLDQVASQARQDKLNPYFDVDQLLSGYEPQNKPSS